MSEDALRFVEVASAALAGRATASAGASTSGRVVAGDDCGEVGLWDASGERLVAFRMAGPVSDVDITPAGDRIVARCASGELTVVDAKGRSVFTAALAGPGLVRLDPQGASLFCVDPETGRVETFNAWGKRIGGFEVPSPVGGCVLHPRDKGLVVATPRGIVARFTAWGEQVWSLDLGRYTGALGIDSRGSLLVVTGYARGAEGLSPDTGERVGSFDVARSVEAAAAARRHVLLGTNEARLVLLDRSAQIVATARTDAKPVAVSLRDDARHAAVRLDDGTVRFWHLTSGVADEPRRPAIVGGAAEGKFPPREAFRRTLFAPSTLLRASLVSLSACGRTVAVTGENRRVLVLRRDGTVTHETRHEGLALALHASSDGTALLVTTREIRRLAPEGPRVLRSFGLDLWRSTIAADGATLATLDELGVLHLVDAVTGSDRASCELGTTDAPRTLMVHGDRVAWQRRGGEVAAAAGGEFRVVRVDSGSGPKQRLASVGAEGPLVVLGTCLAAFGWDGSTRWQQRLAGPPADVHSAPDGTVVCVVAGEIRRFGADGSGVGRFAPPAGRLAALCAAEDGAPVFVFVEGRRITVVDAAGRPLWHTTRREEVAGVSIGREGRSLAAVAGDGVVLMETVPPHSGPLGGRPEVGVATARGS